MTTDAGVEPSAIGIDLGGTHLRVARVSADGRILQKTVEPVTRNAEAVIERLLALSRSLDGPDVAGLGIGVPGRVDAANRSVLSGGYLDLSGSRIAERLQEALGKAVAIDNDCNMALAAEMAFGAARDEAHVVMLTIGTGIGGAVALYGQILRGRAAAGQLGHVTVVREGLACACGRRGCVETTSSGTALGRLIAAAGLPSDTRVEALLDAAGAGDVRSLDIVGHWINPLRDAIDSLVATFDPGLVLLGGGLGWAAHRALEWAPARAPWFQSPVRPAVLGDEAGLIGAALAATGSATRPPRPLPARLRR